MSPVGAARVSRFSQVGGVIPDSVDYHVPFDEGTGTTATPDTGTTDITLFGAGWVTDSRFQGGHAADFVTDDYYQTASQIDINGAAFSVCKWINYSALDNNARIFSNISSPSDNLTTVDGWQVYFDVGNSLLRYYHTSGGSASEVVNIPQPPSNSDLFIALAVDGDAGDLYIWDADSQIGNASGTAPRGQSTSDYLTGMVGDDSYLDGNVDALYASQTTALTELEFQSIWVQTNDGRV